MVRVIDTKSGRLRLNPEPLRVISGKEAQARDLWVAAGENIHLDYGFCSYCGSNRAEREKVNGTWQCVNEKQCRRRQRALGWDLSPEEMR